MKYYDIGLNLFCRQFPDPEKIIADAINNGVCCILTGTDTKENRKINSFVKTHDVYGTVGIHLIILIGQDKRIFSLLRKYCQRILKWWQ